jgi:hypothetical protein
MQRPRRRPRTPDHQLDLFLASPVPTPSPAPGWSVLPDQARHAVIRLMTRLLIAHASGAVPMPGSDGDER